MAKKDTTQPKKPAGKGSRKDPLSKGRITSFAVVAVLAFVLPVLLGGALYVSGWITDSTGSSGITAVSGPPLHMALRQGCEEEKAARDAALQEAALEAAAEEQATGADPCKKILENLPAATEGALYVGGYTPSDAVREAIDACIARTIKQGRSSGFVMLDLKTGKGVIYNTSQEFYGASSIKIHRILAIAEAHPELMKETKWAVRDVLVESDNDSYEWMYLTYGNSVLDKYLSDARASVRYSPGERYAYYSTAAFARMWKHAYDLMQSVPDCDAVGVLAETPYDSSIHRLLSRSYTTRSKAGWIYEGGMRAAADGGIVYDKESPYLLVIMSDYASDLTMLDPYVQALEQAHQEIRKQK